MKTQMPHEPRAGDPDAGAAVLPTSPFRWVRHRLPLRSSAALRWSLYAALGWFFGTGWTVQATALTCADVRARIEQQLAAKAAPLPRLLIVPKGLTAGTHVLGSCENGTQKIVYRAAVPSIAPNQPVTPQPSVARP